jgi:hypothetical protein
MQVQSPESFYRNGKQIGEIDVTLRGRFGTANIFVGIECRARPSEGPQGVAWLNEIVGKKENLCVDKMIAVSTTGFVPEALETAREQRIDLLTFSDYDGPYEPGMLQTIEFGWNEQSHRISGVIEMETDPKTAPWDLTFKADTPIFRRPQDDRLISLNEFIKDDIDSLFAKLPSVPGKKVVANAVIQGGGSMTAIVNGRPVKVVKAAIPVCLEQELVSGNVRLAGCVLPLQGEMIALVGSCRVQVGDRRFKVLTLAKKNRDASNTSALRIDFFSEDDEPYLIPAGTRVTLSGS